MARLRINSIGGYLDAALTAAGTTLTSDALAALGAVAAPDYVPIVLSPDGYIGGPYLARITAHTAAATTATIEAVDTRAVDLPAGVEWVHAIQEDDFPATFSVEATNPGSTTATTWTDTTLTIDVPVEEDDVLLILVSVVYGQGNGRWVAGNIEVGGTAIGTETGTAAYSDGLANLLLDSSLITGGNINIAVTHTVTAGEITTGKTTVVYRHAGSVNGIGSRDGSLIVTRLGRN